MTNKRTFGFFLLSVWAAIFSLIAHWGYRADSTFPVVAAVLLLPAFFSNASLLKVLLDNVGDRRLAIGICTISGIAALWSWRNGSLTFEHAVFAIVPLYQIVMFTISYRLFVRLVHRPPVTVVLKFGEGKRRGPDQLFFFATAMLIGVLPLMTISWSQV